MISKLFQVLLCGCAITAAVQLFAANEPKNVSAKGINLHQWERTELKAHILADTGVLVPGQQGVIYATGFQMFTFGPGGTNDVEMVIEAPESYLDHENRKAWSEGALKAFNASNTFVIQGRGFLVRRTQLGSALSISNDVHTIIRQEDPKTKKLMDPVHIYSDEFDFASQEAGTDDKRIANYRRNVRVDDPEMELTCGALRVVVPGGTNQVRDIIARENVRIRSKADGSEATGQLGVYSTTNEVVTLSGKPTWKDGQNEGRAEQFIFDRANNIIYALTNAELKAPRSTMGNAELLGDGSKKKPVATNGFVTVNAQYFEIALPTTNRVSRSLLAKTNVVIVSPADQTRATAQSAFFDDQTGLLELKQNAVWQTEANIGKGNTIVIDRTNRTFRAEGNASLRMPVNAATNQFLEILSVRYLLRTNIAIFEQNVKADFLDGKAPSSLTCRTLEVYMTSNQVETIVAKGDVIMTQTYAPGSTRRLLCEDLTIKRSLQTGTIQTVLAERNVSMMEQAVQGNRKLIAEVVTMTFGRTNQLDSMLAERNVKVEQGNGWATGERALYLTQKGAEIFEITGKPLAQTVDTDSDGNKDTRTIRNATALRWHPATGEFSASGPFVIE